MTLLTPELLARFGVVGCQDGMPDPLVICKFFNPCGAATWYVTEYLPDEHVCFGYISGLSLDGDEWGYFSLTELESILCPPFDLPIERDLYFTEARFSQLGISIKSLEV